MCLMIGKAVKQLHTYKLHLLSSQNRKTAIILSWSIGNVTAVGLNLLTVNQAKHLRQTGILFFFYHVQLSR